MLGQGMSTQKQGQSSLVVGSGSCHCQLWLNVVSLSQPPPQAELHSKQPWAHTVQARWLRKEGTGGSVESHSFNRLSSSCKTLLAQHCPVLHLKTSPKILLLLDRAHQDLSREQDQCGIAPATPASCRGDGTHWAASAGGSQVSGSGGLLAGSCTEPWGAAWQCS